MDIHEAIWVQVGVGEFKSRKVSFMEEQLVNQTDDVIQDGRAVSRYTLLSFTHTTQTLYRTLPMLSSYCVRLLAGCSCSPYSSLDHATFISRTFPLALRNLFLELCRNAP